jgi:PAS domain S-box-containing protein
MSVLYLGGTFMTFGQRLRQLRKARGMTQRELAQKTAISFAYVSKVETGVMPPPRQKIILALARALGAGNADTDELFGLARKMPPDLLEHVDTGMIKMLRSLGNGGETPAHELAALRRRTAELQASETQGIRPGKLPGRQEGTFRALVENSPDGIVILGSELEVLYENPSAARIVGYESGEFVGKDTLGLIHPDDMFKAAHRLTRMIQTPGDTTTNHVELRVRHKDGTWRVIDAVANNLLHNPAVKGIIVEMRGIGRHSRDERASVQGAAASAMAKEYRLTVSEHRILALIAEGQSNPQIAEQLVVSPSTVRFHVTSILRKLGVSSRSEAAAVAVRRHLVA